MEVKKRRDEKGYRNYRECYKRAFTTHNSHQKLTQEMLRHLL